MCFYIGIEDLAANALIEILSESESDRFVTYQGLENYGAEVVRFLMLQGEKAILIMSRDSTKAMFRDYSDFFIEENSEHGLGIRLKPEKDIDDLIETFRGYLAWDVLMAFMDKKAIAKLRVR